MPDHAIPARRERPWRILVLDRDPADPKWLLATVAIAGDVRPAVLDAAGRHADWAEVTAWVREVLGQDVALVPAHDALAWLVCEPDPSPGAMPV